jgi:hypothetical protein
MLGFATSLLKLVLRQVRNSFFDNSNGVGMVLEEGEQATLSGNAIEGNDGPGIIASCMKGLSILNNYFEVSSSLILRGVQR